MEGEAVGICLSASGVDDSSTSRAIAMRAALDSQAPSLACAV